MKRYQIDPYTGRRKTVVIDDVAVRDYWVLDWKGLRHFVKKGTKVDENGLPIKEETKHDTDY